MSEAALADTNRRRAKVKVQPDEAPAPPSAEGQAPPPVEAAQSRPSPTPSPKLALLPMGEEPQEGKRFMAHGPNGEVAEAFWRSSRRLSRLNGRWETYRLISEANTGGRKIAFEPIGWSPAP